MLDGAIDGYDSYESAVAAQPTTPLDGERIAGTDMLYSSGTTGMPKGVTRPFEAAPLATSPAGVAGLLGMLFGVTDDSVYLSPAPLYHAAPLRFMLGAMGARRHRRGHGALRRRAVPGTRRAPPRDPHPGRADHVRAHAQAARGGARPVRHVVAARCVVHAAAPCPIPVKQQMIEWWGPIIHEYYAGTEGNGFVYCNSEMWLAHPGTVGTPIACVVHICRRGRRGPAALRERHDLLRGRSPVRVPQRPGEDRSVAPPEPAVEHARRRRLPRRRQLPLPHRPQGVHDHLRRGEHLSAGGGERARHPPEGGRRRRVRRAQRRLRRGGQGGRATGRRCRRRRTKPMPWTRS